MFSLPEQHENFTFNYFLYNYTMLLLNCCSGECIVEQEYSHSNLLYVYKP